MLGNQHCPVEMTLETDTGTKLLILPYQRNIVSDRYVIINTVMMMVKLLENFMLVLISS